MLFGKILLLLSASLAAALNTVTFVSQDKTHRTVKFTPSVGHAWLPDARVSAFATVKVDFPAGWIGNWYSVSDGKPDVPGMLGEVTFQGYESKTFFDVSAIVNPNDHEGVQELFPSGAQHPVSGCRRWPCDNAYYLWDDVQTKVTDETALVCTLGFSDILRRGEVEEAEEELAEDVFARGFVEGAF